MKRSLQTLTVLSAVALCFLVITWPLSYFMDLSRSIRSSKLTPSDSQPVFRGYRLGFERGSMWLYTYAMPYRGSIMWMSFTNDPPPLVREWWIGEYGFSHVVRSNSVEKMSERACDLPGIYFRRFWRFNDKPPYTTLSVSLWYPIALFSILPLWWSVHRTGFLLRKRMPNKSPTAPAAATGS